MKKKVKLLNFFNPLNKLTRESSLKILITEKELDKKRNISIDFSSTPFKPIKKVIKRNIRQNSFNNIIFNKTENINKSNINNISYMPSCNLILNKNYSLYNNNNNNININNFSIKKFPNCFNIKNKNQIKSSLVKKNSKIFKINTHSFIEQPKNLLKDFKTFASIKNNNKNIINNTNNNSNIYNTNSFIINNKKKIIPIKTNINTKSKIKLKNKNKVIININNSNNNKYNNKGKQNKLKKNNKKNLSTNFKLSAEDFLKIIKNSKNITPNPHIKERKHSLTLSNTNLCTINEGNIKLLCENIKLKKKNEELINKINYISKEFNEIKKDNNDIKEELKEKNNTLNNIKLTMDIFNQELVRLQNSINNNKKEQIKKLNKKNEFNDNNEKTPSTGLGYAYDKKNFSNEIKVINNSYKDESIISDENNISLADNININKEEYNKALNKSHQVNKFQKKNIYNNSNGNAINNLNLVKPNEKNEFISDFNQEFLKNVDNFSESWRKEVEKMLHRKKNNENN